MFVATSDVTAGSAESTLAEQPDAFQNPFCETVFITASGQSYEVFDANCKLIESGNAAGKKVEIGRDFLPGIYFVRFQNGAVRKIIKY
jgi:hypothetical protein